LAELVDPKRAALLVWDMEYAIAPNAFNYKDILANLQQLSGAARQVGGRFSSRSRRLSTSPGRSRRLGADTNEKIESFRSESTTGRAGRSPRSRNRR
jgi:hypothetical protein